MRSLRELCLKNTSDRRPDEADADRVGSLELTTHAVTRVGGENYFSSYGWFCSGTRDCMKAKKDSTWLMQKLSRRRGLLSVPLRRILLFLGAVSVVCHCGAAWDFRQRLRAIKVGMSESEVIEKLGPPNFTTAAKTVLDQDALYYRFSTLAKRFDGQAMSAQAAGAASDPALVGRIRVDLKDGLVTHVAGVWPAPKRPPAAVKKHQVMLIDVPKAYDRLKRITDANTKIRTQEIESQSKLDVINAEGNALLAEHEKLTKEAKRFKGSAAKRAALDQQVEATREKINAKKAESDAFVAQTHASLREWVERIRDFILPALSDAILRFKAERGYEYVYELKEGVLADVGVKPLKVSGVDETEELLKWINAGGAGPGL